MGRPTHPNQIDTYVHDVAGVTVARGVRRLAEAIDATLDDHGIAWESVGDIVIKPPDKVRLRKYPRDWLILIYSRNPDGFQELDPKDYGL